MAGNRYFGAGIAAAGALVATSAVAHAAPFTVKAGSAASGTAVAVTGRSGTSTSRTPPPRHADVHVVDAHGFDQGGHRQDRDEIAAVNGSTAVFNSCTGPAGLKFKVTGVDTWNINITDSTSGVSKGTVSNIVANVASTAGPTCTFSVGANAGSFSGTVAPGTVTSTYTNSSTALAVPASNPGALGLWNVKGTGTNTYCVAASILKQGDKASFQATYTIKANTAAYHPLTIT